MNILVLGFSVTAEKQGYVESAISNLPSGSELNITKVGLGGMQPYHARYLFPSIIAAHSPDVLVLDHSTPAFRNFSLSQIPYKSAFLSILRECQEQRIRLAVLDLPRADVDYEDDWVSAWNSEICTKLGLPYTLVPLDAGLLRDEVHPTEAGLRAYEVALMGLILQAATVKVPTEVLAGLPRYSAINIADMADLNLARQRIDRGNFVVDLVDLPAGSDLCLAFDPPIKVCGLTARMGPRTGMLRLELDESRLEQMCYDKFSYYDRVGAFLFGGQKASVAQTISSLRIEQSSELPKIELMKGTRNTDSRVGALGHIFIEYRE